MRRVAVVGSSLMADVVAALAGVRLPSGPAEVLLLEHKASSRAETIRDAGLADARIARAEERRRRRRARAGGAK